MCICSILFLCVLIYSSLLREYVAAAVQFLLQNIKNTCRRSRKFSYDDYLQKWTQSPWNLHRGHNNQIKLLISLWRVCVDQERVMATEEDFFFVGFFISSSSGTLRSMTIKRHGHLCATRVTSSQLAINPATYTSDCDSTFSGRHNLHRGNINLM